MIPGCKPPPFGYYNSSPVEDMHTKLMFSSGYKPPHSGYYDFNPIKGMYSPPKSLLMSMNFHVQESVFWF